MTDTIVDEIPFGTPLKRPASGCEPGRLFDGHLIECLLGRGGQGQVFRVRHRVTQQDVVLKCIRKSGGRTFTRFTREVDVLVNTPKHPGIVGVIPIASDADGLIYHGTWSSTDQEWLYYLMEYLPGQSLALAAHLDAKRFTDLAVALPLWLHIAMALEHAHRQNIIHRDIKPDNIMLTDAGPVIVDWGLGAFGSDFTHYTSGLGTPGWRPHEVIDLDTGVHTDVYGLAGILFWMLTGGITPNEVANSSIIAEELEHRRRCLPDKVHALAPPLACAMAHNKRDRTRSVADLRKGVNRCVSGLSHLTWWEHLCRAIGRGRCRDTYVANR